MNEAARAVWKSTRKIIFTIWTLYVSFKAGSFIVDLLTPRPTFHGIQIFKPSSAEYALAALLVATACANWFAVWSFRRKDSKPVAWEVRVLNLVALAVVLLLAFLEPRPTKPLPPDFCHDIDRCPPEGPQPSPR